MAQYTQSSTAMLEIVTINDSLSDEFSRNVSVPKVLYIPSPLMFVF